MLSTELLQIKKINVRKYLLNCTVVQYLHGATTPQLIKRTVYYQYDYPLHNYAMCMYAFNL